MPENDEPRGTDRGPVRPEAGRPEDQERNVRLSEGQLPGITPPESGRDPEPDSSGTQRIPKESDTERTDNIPVVPASAAPPPPSWDADNAPTQAFAPVPASTATWSYGGDSGSGDPSTGAPAAGESAAGGPARKRRGLVKGGIGAGIAVGLLALLYIGDVVITSGEVPRGTTVAGVPIGSLDKAAAERELREQLGPNLSKPVTITAGDAQASLRPEEAGLSMDWASTVEHAGSQSYNPITRLTSLFTTTEVAPVSHGDRAELTRALEKVKPRLDRAPAEGAIRFEGAQPVADDPVTGRSVDIAAAADAVLDQWARPGQVRVPAAEQPVSTNHDGVRKALTEIAEPAVSAPVIVHGEGKDATLAPETVAAALKFEPDGNGGLKPRVDVPAAVAGVAPQLADTVRPGNDAQIVFENGAPVVHPSTDGHGIDWGRSFERLLDVLKQRGDRSVPAIYAQQPAKFTTDQANQLGIHEVVGEFQTSGFDPASGANIKRVAEQVNGAVIKPGETFSLNGHTGPRGVPQGYIESGVIENGRPAKAVGGGISQFATTLYNASYFAGMKDVEHKEHSYYISRYPQGREATVFQNPNGSSVIDVKFKNTSASGIMITTTWTPTGIKIKFWGTKQYDVSSQTGPQSNPSPPQEKVVPPGEPCSPSTGKPGFTVTDTRTLRDVRTGKVTTEKPSKTVYNPHPNIHCPASPG